MSEGLEEIYDLVRLYKIKKSSLFNKHHQNTIERYSIEMDYKKGRHVLNGKASLQKMEKMISRYSVNISTFFSTEPEHKASCLRSIDVVYHNNDFKVMYSMVSLSKLFKQPYLKLDSIISNMVISTHAVARWLERNNSKDIDKCLFTLGKAFLDADKHLLYSSLDNDKLPVGLTEFQFRCDCGGIAFIILKNPEGFSYSELDWVITTYINKDMIQWWNECEMAKELTNLENISDWIDGQEKRSFKRMKKLYDKNKVEVKKLMNLQ